PVYGIALLIALVCSVVVYNIFYISVMGKLREYGRLKVIGTTPRQLRAVVRYERRVLMWISIPLGILAAALLTVLLYPGYWDWAKNLRYTVFIVVVTVGMVVTATRKPLQLAGRVSAIEAIRSNAYQALSGVSRTLHRPLSVFRLACMNFTRSRKKTVLTLVSLGLTGILTACIASYASSVNAAELARNGFGGSDYVVAIEDNNELADAQRDGLLNAEVRERLLALPGVDSIMAYSAMYCTVEQCPRADERFLIGGFTEEQMAMYQENSLVREGTVDYETLRANNGILFTRTSDDLLKKIYHFDVSVGDTITLHSMEGASKDYTVMGIVDMIRGSGTVKFFVLPEEELHLFYPDVEDFTGRINIYTPQASDEQRQALYTLFDDPRVEIAALADMVIWTETNLQQMFLMLYGVVAFIALFALINLVNTMMTNLLTRRQEFGILQSVGMTSRQLSRMISAECFCYVGVTLLITFSVGTACGFGIVRIFNQLDLFGTLTYHVPVSALLVFAAALFVVYGVFSLAAVRILRRQSLVERIKEME
ncbi:MAG: FtsX-like permease family protein, partial [Lachnospiraceae bacterium]|nr:FtsX-like permease family protein [Lachnospiraceae bacterium]